MAYTEDFKHILAKRNQINNANLFVFKNNTPRSMKVFPEEVSNVLLEHNRCSIIRCRIVEKCPFHAVSWHCKLCIVSLRILSFYPFKHQINTRLPGIL